MMASTNGHRYWHLCDAETNIFDGLQQSVSRSNYAQLSSLINIWRDEWLKKAAIN